jgi:hypothetical protein
MLSTVVDMAHGVLGDAAHGVLGDAAHGVLGDVAHGVARRVASDAAPARCDRRGNRRPESPHGIAARNSRTEQPPNRSEIALNGSPLPTVNTTSDDPP